MIKKIYYGLLIASILTIAGLFNQISFASTDDFVIDSFTADYYLDRDGDGRSILKTVEQITAIFPDYDQNHGIERAIPKIYSYHKASLHIVSVKDDNGNNLDFSTRDSNDNLVIRIGDADRYVHGQVTYHIIYTQRDVTKSFADTDSDEFYWDVNGDQWSQPFNKVTARLHLSDNIIGALNGKMSCYYGRYRSSNNCEIQNDNNIITVEQNDLKPYETVTFAVGFAPNTFEVYQKTLIEEILEYGVYFYGGYCALASVIILIIAVVILRLRFTRGKGVPNTRAIVAEYLPPSGVAVATSANILNKRYSCTAAMFVDLAVRHNIKIIEEKDSGFLAKPTYTIEFISENGLNDIEKQMIHALFGDVAVAGDKFSIDPNKPSTSFVSKIERIYKKAGSLAIEDGYVTIDVALNSKMTKLSSISLVLGILGLFGFLPAFLGISLSVTGFILIETMKPLSQKGRDLVDYLDGLKLYIKIAEEDRLKVLQSPSGADKTPIDINNKSELVHLYERVLPYAILFNQEKEWSKKLGVFYEQQAENPSWYVGSGIFNSVAFASSLSNFSTSSTSYSTPASSSSGGSGGGGFSGGGGGGGGGGGW